MKRREFMTLLGSGATLAVSPFAALAQQRATKIPRIGIIDETPMRGTQTMLRTPQFSRNCEPRYPRCG